MSGASRVPGGDVRIAVALNLDNPRIKLWHSRLLRVSAESAYRSACPFCPQGLFFVVRDAEMRLMRGDRCLWCGQAVEYLDNGINDEPFGPK